MSVDCKKIKWNLDVSIARDKNFDNFWNCGDVFLCRSFPSSTEILVFSPFSYKDIKEGPILQQEYTMQIRAAKIWHALIC